MYKAILFDLDGTLTESGEGITKCVQYALEKLGRPESDLENVYRTTADGAVYEVCRSG